jgi:serine/threonine-protein kinase RsbW
VNEVATNIIVHGYEDQVGIIEVEIGREGDSMIIRLRDQASPFDPTRVPAPDLSLPLEERPLGGVGVYLTMKLMDEVIHLVPPEGGNELILVKKGILKSPQGGVNDHKH